MKHQFLYYCRAYAHRMDTSNPMGHGESEELNLKGDSPELTEKMAEVSKMLDKDESVFVIKDNHFDYAIDRAYVQPALHLRDMRDEGKVVMNAHLFLLYLLFMAVAPLLVFIWLYHKAGVI